MAKGPAVVIVARHGARLDAADKTWHLSSPTPYDPPLTFGGWSQGRALGLRIAALLHQRDQEQQAAAQHASGLEAQRPRKKRKIVIHSSPYLRCVQTSTAVAAGIAQYTPPAVPTLSVPTPERDRAAQATAPPAATTASKHTLQPSTVTRLTDPQSNNTPKPYTGPERILLRIDAFLGEWLSPDYYEHITPPPNSTLMVAGAKADLLRRGDAMLEMANPNTTIGFFPGGWMAKPAPPRSKQHTDNEPRPSMRSLASVSPLRERSSSQGASPLQRTTSRDNVPSLAPPPPNNQRRVYEPPVPTYSVSAVDPIPRGYFAHAREACVLVDFQWDSMRPPQEWGDGGEYGDEWSTMHKRFRRGLCGMMDWYREHGADPPKNRISGFMFREPLRLTPVPAAKRPTEPFPSLDGLDAPSDDEELVLILLTHGAGCNALLAAMTNQPVLMDIGLASLSMAVRRAVPREPSEASLLQRRLSIADPGMAETYHVTLMASVDHLKPGVDPSKLHSQSQTKSPAVLPSPSLESRRRFGASPVASPGDSHFDPFRNWNPSMASSRRAVSSGSSKFYAQSNVNSTSPSTATGGGLWGSSKPTAEKAEKEKAEKEKAASVAPQRSKPAPKVSTTVKASIPGLDGTADMTDALQRLNTNEQKEVSDSVAPLLPRTRETKSSTASSSSGLWGAKAQPKSTSGLWGPPRLDDVYEHRPGPKRRWTVTEREESL
ncbi:hypothetical protein ACEQ8H_003172 [Pleosporales sp. CAS-2024a]